MSKYMDLLARMEELSKELEEVKAKEYEEVVERMKREIEAFGISAEDLGFKPAARRFRKSEAKLPAKYADGLGHTWSGKGNKPEWFRNALKMGRKADDLLIGKQHSAS